MSELQQRVTHDLRRVAGDLEVPPVPLDTLVAAGRRRQQHRRVGLVAVLVVVVAVIVGGVGLAGSMLSAPARPQPVHHGPSRPHATPAPGPVPLRTGALPRIPYWHDGELFLSTGRMRTPDPDLRAAGGVVLMGKRRPDNFEDWTQVTPGPARRLPVPTHASGPLLSADGRLAVWEEIHPNVTRVVAWDTTHASVLATRDVQVQQICCSGPSLILSGVDNAGQVFFSTGRPLTLWNVHDNTTHTVTGLDTLPSLPDRMTATGLVLQGNAEGFDDAPGVYGTVDPHGRFHRSGTTPWDMGSWSPDATLVEYPADDTGRFVLKGARTTEMVLDTRTGKAVRMHLPSGDYGPVGWEDDHTLLVTAGSGRYRYDVLRCQTTSGTCEIAARNARHWRFPPA